MSDEESLSPAEISWLASIVADGSAKPDEARRLIQEFVRQARTAAIDPRLIGHLQDCFAAFLTGKKELLPSPEAGRNVSVIVKVKTLEKAFGLTRAMSGQPPIDSDTLCAVAMELLEQRLAGVSHQTALTNVAEDRKQAGLPVSSETEIGKAWTDHKRDALVGLRLFRAVGLDPACPYWTSEEMERLAQIYADVPGIVLPGEKAFEGRHAIPGQERSEPIGSENESTTPENSKNKPSCQDR